MADYAIVESGGRQFRVEEGTELLVNRLPEDEGAKVLLRAVAFNGDGDSVLAGSDLEKVKVEAKVAGHLRGEKVRIFKHRPKKGYRRRAGHRQELTRLEVTEVKLGSRKPAAKKAADEKPKAEQKKAEKPAAKKADEKKPAAKKADEKKPAAKKGSAKKGSAKKADEKKPAAKKPSAAKKKGD